MQVHTVERHATAAVCAFESVAIWTGIVPTITALTRSRHWRWIRWVLLGYLAYHFASDK